MLKNTLSINVAWGHCDPANIVFYPNYFIWFDQSSHLLFDKVGANMSSLTKEFGVVGLPIVRCSFRISCSIFVLRHDRSYKLV